MIIGFGIIAALVFGLFTGMGLEKMSVRRKGDKYEN